MVMRNVESWTPPCRTPWPTLVAALTVLTIFAGPAAQALDPDDGIVVGKFILAPRFEATWGVDSNIFREVESRQHSDAVATTRAGLDAFMPFGNSSLSLGLGIGKEEFQNADFSRNTSKLGEAELELNFRSGDTLTLYDGFTQDFARLNDVGEQNFDGEPYSLNRLEVELKRDNHRRQGYVIRLRHLDFTYDDLITVPGLFEYRGFDNYFEYRRPTPGDRVWVARYQTRRFDHFEANDTTGVPFREELTDSVQLGLQGYLGLDQPYIVRIGFARFRYDVPATSNATPSEGNGLVGFFAWQLRVGPRTAVELEAIRRPLPSNFDTFYVNNAVKAKLVREWRRHETGTDLRYYLNNYADPIGSCNRRDSTYELEVFWDWKVHERFDFGVEAFHSHRSSTCDVFTYRATGLATGFTVGW